MPSPNTFRQKVREDAERAINRRMEEQSIGEDALETAKDEWSLESYENFFGDCRSAGHDATRCGALWTQLKEQGEAPAGGEASDDAGNEEAPEAAMPALPVPETMDEMEEQLREAEGVHLIVTSGCPACNEVKDALSDWIDEGLVTVQNVQESDKAADIVIETGVEALPSLVMENDGEFIPF